jgi:uncharacterized membrane protein YhaH (DUF805 family)
MGPTQAVSSVFSKYATFSGRARRSEYWWFVAFSVLLLVIAAVIDNAAGLHFKDQAIGWAYSIVALLLFIPSIAVTIRRLHDTGRSGWWWFLSLLCGIGAIILFVFCLLEGTSGPNEYGPDPKS